MTRLGSALEFIASCLVYSAIVTIIDAVIILFFTSQLVQILYALSFVMLVEGGVGLVIGGAMASYSPSIGKIGEVIFRSKPWTAQRRKEAERQGATWIVTGAILVVVGLLVSAF